MLTLRLIMEDFIQKNYSDHSYSYFGDLIRPPSTSNTSIKVYHPFYHIHFKDKPTLCIVGIQPDRIMFLCLEGIKKIQDFEIGITSYLMWFLESDGKIYGKHKSDIYSIEYVLTGFKNAKHIDANPLNNQLNNLINPGEKKNETK